MDTFRTDKSISEQDDDRVTGLVRLAPIILAALFGLTPIGMTLAQPSKTTHPMVKSKSGNVSGVNTITPKEVDDKTTKNGSG